MSKEEILKERVGKLVYESTPLVNKQDALFAMQQYADQEKQKVAVAFAEWKDNNVIKEEHGDYYFWDDDGYMFLKSITDLYQYFIENIYNK